MTDPTFSGAVYPASQWGWFAGLAKRFLRLAAGEKSEALRKSYLQEARENARVARSYYDLMESEVEA